MLSTSTEYGEIQGLEKGIGSVHRPRAQNVIGAHGPNDKTRPHKFKKEEGHYCGRKTLKVASKPDQSMAIPAK